MPLNRKIKSLIFAFCCMAVFGALAFFANQRQLQKSCEKVSIAIENEYNNYFISDREVTELLTKNGVEKITGKNREEINLKNLEMRIKAHKFVKEAQVSRDLKGNLRVSIKQNRPIARIIQSESDQDVYIDDEGNILPLSERFTARVIPITKSEQSPALNTAFFQDSVGKSYLSLLQFIDHDNFWKAQLAQMHIDAKGKVSFMPQVGDQVIEFGLPEDIERKFKRLMIVYKHVLPNMGWTRYKRVNIEFNDQIICE
jgi:cell division protein FtsQ